MQTDHKFHSVKAVPLADNAGSLPSAVTVNGRTAARSSSPHNQLTAGQLTAAARPTAVSKARGSPKHRAKTCIWRKSDGVGGGASRKREIVLEGESSFSN